MARYSVVFSPDGTYFAVSMIAPIVVEMADPSHYRQLTPGAAPIYRADTSAQDLRKSQLSFGAPTETNPSAAFTADGRWLIARSADGQLDFFDTATGNRIPFRIPTDLDYRQPPLSTAASGRYVFVRTEMKQEQKTVQTTVQVPKMFYRKETQVVDRGVVRGAFTTQTVDTITGQIVRVAKFENVVCVSGGGEFAVEYTTTSKGSGIAMLKSAKDGVIADLAQRNVDLSAGCSISHNGKYMIVAGIGGKSAKPPPPDSNSPVWRKEALAIYDVAGNRIVASLQDANGKPEEFSWRASFIAWTADDRYLFGGGISTLVERHGPLAVFDAATGRELHTLPDSGQTTILEIAPDGKIGVVGSGRNALSILNPAGDLFGVDVCDLNSGKILYSLPAASAAPDALAFSPNGKTIVGPDRNGGISVWRRSDGALLGELRALQEGEWLVHSPSGLFDGSPRAWSLISWKDSDHSLDPAAGEIYFNEFYRPGLLADLLDGRQPQSDRKIATVDRRQPTVTVTATRTREGAAALQVRATEAPASAANPKGSGVRDLRLFRNGQLIKAWRGSLDLDRDGSINFEINAPVIAGPNRFAAYAFNADNVKSANAEAVLNVSGSPRPGVAYVVTIGVNEYSNSDFNLKYAVADADLIAAELIQHQKDLGQFSAVRSVTLRDSQATRANILLALSRLAGESTGPLPAGAPEELQKLRTIEPEDALILYFAGHGIASGDRFFLVPHDLGFSGPRAEIRANISKILEHGISDQDLQRSLEPIDARHIILIIDACQSGQALESDDDRRGPMNSRGLAQLAWEKGISILAASQAYQAALESSRFGHGYLTFALTQEALQTPVADTTPADGSVTETEWLEYAARRVPQLQIDALESAKAAGRTLTLEVVPDGAASSRLQSPRLFTRRDAPGAPLVVARFR